MKKTEKAIFVQNLVEELKDTESAILVDFSGLSVTAQQELKKKLSEVNSKMIVVKNTLFKLAGKKVGLPKKALTDSVLTGQTALVVSEKDPISPLFVLAKFALEYETPQFKVGIIEKAFQNKNELTKLSKLSGKDALAAQTLGVIASPTHSLISVLQNNLQSLVFVLDRKVQKGGDN